MPQNSRRVTGSTPVVGSSRTAPSGVWISVQRERELLLHAAGELPGAAVAERLEPAEGHQLAVARARARRGGTPNRSAKKRRFSATRQVGVEAEALRHVAEVLLDGPRLARAVVPEHASPCRRRAAAGRRAMRMVVVLPAPSGPIRPQIWPAGTDSESPRTRRGWRRSSCAGPSSAMAAPLTAGRPRPACPRAAGRRGWHAQLDGVDQLGAGVARLRVLGRELGLGGRPRSPGRSAARRAARRRAPAGLARAARVQVAGLQVDAQFEVREVRQPQRRAPGRGRPRPARGSASAPCPSSGDTHDAVAQLPVEHRQRRRRGAPARRRWRDAAARGVDAGCAATSRCGGQVVDLLAGGAALVQQRRRAREGGLQQGELAAAIWPGRLRRPRRCARRRGRLAAVSRALQGDQFGVEHDQRVAGAPRARLPGA